MTDVATTEMTAARLDQAAIEAFQASLRGTLLRPGDDGYDAARGIWNGMIDRQPALIVRCAGAADVIRALSFARTHDLTVAVKGGGHSVSGASVCDGGLMIDLSAMKGIRVDPKNRTVRAEPGLTWGEFDAETQAFGLAVTGGQVSHTGIAGLTLGGGVGNLMRKRGALVDNLLAADVVTADGQLLTASGEENSDLFWAIRGGGGNFGVVTSFEYRVYPVGPLVVGGMAGFEIERAREICEFYREYAANAPDELGLTLAFITAPPAPFVPEHLHFKPVVAIAPCHSGPIEQGMKDLEPVRALHPAFDVISPMPYTVVQSLFDEGFPSGERRYYVKAGFLTALSDEVIDRLLTHFSTPSSPFSAVVAVAMGGALGRVDANATAFAHREASFDCTIFASWVDQAEDEVHVAWARAFYEGLRPFLHGVYVNALDHEHDRPTEAYPEETYRRLVEIKNRYDPTNIFRLNQNIKPTV